MRCGSRLQHSVAGALCALLLLAAPRPTIAAGGEPITALLLVAGDGLSDPNFSDSRVLVMNNLGPGPVGLIVNRPTRLAVSRLFPDLKRLARLPDRVYFGGPVDFGSVWFLVRTATAPANAVRACEGVYVSADRALLLRLLGREKPMDGLRIFIGHAGWLPEQLQAEIEAGAWTLKRADAKAIFDGRSEHPWPAPHSPKRGS